MPEVEEMRMLPFGYGIREGMLVVEESEAAFVREVFEKRAQGETYAGIAESLQSRGIAFDDGAAGWDKHKIRRILENERYIGKDGFPPILSEEAYGKARSYAPVQSTKKPCHPAVQKLKPVIRCGLCGAKMNRDYMRRRTCNPIAWTCGECGAKLFLADEALLECIAEAQRWMKQKLMEQKEKTAPIPESAESRILESGIRKLLGEPQRDREELRKRILQWTAARYEAAKDARIDHGERMRLLLEEHTLEQYDAALTEETVEAVLLQEPHIIRIRFMNGREISVGKEE